EGRRRHSPRLFSEPCSGEHGFVVQSGPHASRIAHPRKADELLRAESGLHVAPPTGSHALVAAATLSLPGAHHRQGDVMRAISCAVLLASFTVVAPDRAMA